jgi:hypothetical protein
MIDLAVQFAVTLGIAAWLPGPGEDPRDWLGARFALAGCIVAVPLFLGAVVFALPLTVLVWALAIVGVVALAAALALRRDALGAPSHPTYVLAALLLVLAGVHGGFDYQPYLGDEFASWLNLTRQIYVTDAAQSSAMDYHLPNYTDGWPLLLAAASAPYPSYSPAHAVPTQFLLHLGVIGFVYDIVRAHVRERFSLLAWGCVVVLLAAEVTWKLLPTDMLIEQPLLYASALCLLAILAYETNGCPARRIACYLGVALAAGYLFKLSMVAMLPAPALFLFVLAWRGERRELPLLCLTTFAPIVSVALIWHFAASGGEMGATVGSNAMPKVDTALVLRMAADLWTFVSTYKLPLTIGTLAAFAGAAITGRNRISLLAFAGFLLLYLGGMYVAYLGRYQGLVAPDQPLEYFQRFIILPVRLLHLLGLVLAVLMAEWLARTKWARYGLLAIGLAGLAWQGRALDRSLDDMADRRFQDPTLIRRVLALKRDAAQLAGEIAARGLQAPSVGLIDPLGYGVAHDAVLYYSLSERRGGPLRLYRASMIAADERNLAQYDVLWPVTVTAALRDRIAAAAADDACAQQPERYFLIRRSAGGFDCVRRAAAS